MRTRKPPICSSIRSRIAALERLVGKQALELEFLKGTVKSAPRPKCATASVIVGPLASVSQKDAFYDQPYAARDESAIVEAIASICDEFEFYGRRRVRAELRHHGMSSITRRSGG